MGAFMIYVGLLIVAWQLGRIADALSPKNTESEHD